MEEKRCVECCCAEEALDTLLHDKPDMSQGKRKGRCITPQRRLSDDHSTDIEASSDFDNVQEDYLANLQCSSDVTDTEAQQVSPALVQSAELSSVAIH